MYPSLSIGTIPDSPHSGGLFPKNVSLQNLNKYFLNLGSRHTSMRTPSIPAALPSFICLIAMFGFC